MYMCVQLHPHISLYISLILSSSVNGVDQAVLSVGRFGGFVRDGTGGISLERLRLVNRRSVGLDACDCGLTLLSSGDTLSLDLNSGRSSSEKPPDAYSSSETTSARCPCPWCGSDGEVMDRA